MTLYTFHRATGHRATGVALVIVLLGVVVVLGLVASMGMVSLADLKAAAETTQRSRAFYLAEGGLSSARWELSEEQDPQSDGRGNLNESTDAGTCTVTAEDLGGDYYKLTSTASSGSSSVSLEEIVRPEYRSSFPGGAISVVGGLEQVEYQLNLEGIADLFLDGGDSPGILLSDTDMYQKLGQECAKAVKRGEIEATDVTGSVVNTFQPGDAKLSIHQLPPGEVSVSILASMYTDFRNHIKNNFLPVAASLTLPGFGNVTYGTPVTPVTYQFPVAQKVKSGQTVSGHGTLVFTRNLVIEAGGSLEWNGNLVIYGDDNNDAFMGIAGELKVTGNIVLIGGTGRDVKFVVASTGKVVSTGALTAMTEYLTAGTKIEFLIENELTVNGLLTTVASKHQTEFKPGSDVNITGSFQIGRPLEAVANTGIKMQFEDAFTCVKDNAAINEGAKALLQMGIDLGTTAVTETLVRRELVTYTWRVLPGSDPSPSSLPVPGF